MGAAFNGALALQSFGAGWSAYGSYQQATRQKSVLNYEAAIASNNAKIAEMQGQQAEVVGAQMEMAQRMKTALTVGSARASLAANGVDLTYGTAANVLATTAYNGERDVMTIRDNTARAKWGYDVQAQNYKSEAAFDTSNAESINPTMAGVSSLLNGASGVAVSYANYKAATQGTK